VKIANVVVKDDLRARYIWPVVSARIKIEFLFSLSEGEQRRNKTQQYAQDSELEFHKFFSDKKRPNFHARDVTIFKSNF
jgi:hypothetical protein